jgi:hypothetical protein
MALAACTGGPNPAQDAASSDAPATAQDAGTSGEAAFESGSPIDGSLFDGPKALPSREREIQIAGPTPACDERPTTPLTRFWFAAIFTESDAWRVRIPDGFKVTVNIKDPSSSSSSWILSQASLRAVAEPDFVYPAARPGGTPGAAHEAVVPPGWYDVVAAVETSTREGEHTTRIDRLASTRILVCGDTTIDLAVEPLPALVAKPVKVSGLDRLGITGNYTLHFERPDRRLSFQASGTKAAGETSALVALPGELLIATLRYHEIPNLGESAAHASGAIKLAMAPLGAAANYTFDLPPVARVEGMVADPANALTEGRPEYNPQEVRCDDAERPRDAFEDFAFARVDEYSEATFYPRTLAFHLIVRKGLRCDFGGRFRIKLGVGGVDAPGSPDNQGGNLYLPRPGVETLTVSDDFIRDLALRPPAPQVREVIRVEDAAGRGRFGYLDLRSLRLSDWQTAGLGVIVRANGEGLYVINALPGTYRVLWMQMPQ